MYKGQKADEMLTLVTTAFEGEPRHVQLATMRWLIGRFQFTEEELLGPTLLPGPTGRVK